MEAALAVEGDFGIDGDFVATSAPKGDVQSPVARIRRQLGVAAGPVGRTAGAWTDALMHAAVLSYSRSRGVFAGVDAKGIVLRPEDDLNMAVYHTTRASCCATKPLESRQRGLG